MIMYRTVLSVVGWPITALSGQSMPRSLRRTSRAVEHILTPIRIALGLATQEDLFGYNCLPYVWPTYSILLESQAGPQIVGRLLLPDLPPLWHGAEQEQMTFNEVREARTLVPRVKTSYRSAR